MWLAINSFRYNGGVEGKAPLETIKASEDLQEMLAWLESEMLLFRVQIVRVPSQIECARYNTPAASDTERILAAGWKGHRQNSCFSIRDLMLHQDSLTREWFIRNELRVEVYRGETLTMALFHSGTLKE